MDDREVISIWSSDKFRATREDNWSWQIIRLDYEQLLTDGTRREKHLALYLQAGAFEKLRIAVNTPEKSTPLEGSPVDEDEYPFGDDADDYPIGDKTCTVVLGGPQAQVNFHEDSECVAKEVQ